jgi:phosphomevalonate kinase
MNNLQPFLETGTTLKDVHKTGLGSSAALTTALIVSLLLKLEVIDARDLKNPADASDGLILAHNLTQWVHCFAQGKVGSGFDVSSAIFGSHVYRRFNPYVLEDLMTDEVRCDVFAQLYAQFS